MVPIKTTPFVRLLITTSVAVFLVQILADTFLGTHLFEVLGLVPYRVFHQYALWQFLSFQFVHQDLFHVLFNMLVLWMIGSELEGRWGSRFFAKYYLTCGVSGGVLYVLVQYLFFKGTPANLIPVVGSSGGVYGLLVAYGIIFSERVMLFMMIFPMKAKFFVLLLAGVEFISTVMGTRTGVANLAHLGGMASGFLYLSGLAYLRVRSRQKNKKRGSGKGRSHLRLVINNELFDEFDSGQDDNTDGSGPLSH